MSLITEIVFALILLHHQSASTHERRFAGWIRFGDPGVKVSLRDGIGGTTRVVQPPLTGTRLYAGQTIRVLGNGSIRLALYNRLTKLASPNSYTIPAGPSRDLVGLDLHEKYLLRGGGVRKVEDEMSAIWLADSLACLADYGNHDFDFNIRLSVHKQHWAFESKSPSNTSNNQALTDSDEAVIEYQLGSPNPIYLYFFDVDATGDVSRFYTDYDSSLRISSSNSQWVRIPDPMSWAIPSPEASQSDEVEYVLASTKKLDMMRFDNGAWSKYAFISQADNPLMTILGLDGNTGAKWTLLSCAFTIRRH